jgi:PAS domain S-box-containing protein
VSLLAVTPRTGHHAGVTPQVAAEEELPPDPSSAARARRLLRRVMAHVDDEDTRDAAQLAISEIVTNALVHAGPPLRLRILLADQALRVELSDGNPRLPLHQDFGPTAPTGRGLLLVEELVTRWGSHPLPDGKVVWFEINDAEALDDLLPEPDEVRTSDDSPVVVELHRMPLLMHQAWQEHAAALLREVLLVRLDAELSALEEHASASDALGLLREQVPAPDVGLDPDSLMANATEPAVSLQRVVIEVPRASLPSIEALDVMLDEALHLAENGELLLPPTQPEIQAMRLWICDQVRSQAAGGRSVAWPSMAAALPPGHAPELEWDPHEVSSSDRALVAADDANRVVAVSRAALDLLGYDAADDLVGRRLVAIIPERFHQAHVAGFTLHLVNGRAPLLGRLVRVPALRRDGSEVELGLRIESHPLPEGRYLFTAELFD